MENQIYSSLDIGTTSIKVVISEYINGEMNVIGVGSEESKGLKRGMIVDIDEVVQSIKRASNLASEKAGVQIQQFIVGVPANGIQIEPVHGIISMENSNQEISDQEVIQVVEQAVANKVPKDRTLTSLALEEFIVDGFDEISDPRGMVGNRIEMYGTSISVPKTILHNIRTCVNRAGYGIQNLVLHPQAMSYEALSKDERAFGTVQVDMGGGQTTISAIHDHQVKYASVIQEGGEYVSRDISIVLNTSQENAERLKREVGFRQENSDHTLFVDIVGQDEPEEVDETYISEIISARIYQIFEQAKKEFDKIGALELPGGVRLSGGSSSIPHIADIARDVFGVKVDAYVPEQMGIRKPAYTNTLGLIRYQYNLTDVQQVINHYILGSIGVNTNQSRPPQTIKNNIDDARVEETNQKQFKKINVSTSKEKKPENEDSWLDKLNNFFSDFFE